MVPTTDSLTVSATPLAKLRPPRVRHDELRRDQLLAQKRIRDAEILAICAPAGFGKSTLAIQWASGSGLPIAWLTCDESDGDAVVLLSGLSSALTQSSAGYQAPQSTATLEEPSFSRTVLPQFERSVSSLRSPVAVVLDDLHLVSGEQARKVLIGFVNALPEGSQVAVVGRSLRILPRPLWRGLGRVVELTADELAFGPDETREALTVFSDASVTDDEVEDVARSSQGWPVAVFLMSQTGQPTSSRASIEEFIEAEVLATMPDALRTFVLATAALGSVDVDLATAATGQRRAAHYLNEAITTVLLHKADDGWYRYHPLMQQCATDLLLREDPDLLQSVRARAALWYMQEGYPEPAAQLALASRDRDTLAQVFWPAARLSLLQGRTRTVIAWLDVLGDRLLTEVPELSLAAAWTNMAASDFGHVLRYADATLKALPRQWQDDLSSSRVGPELAIMLAITGYTLSGPHEAATLAGRGLDALGSDDPTRPLAALVVGLNLSITGHPGARRSLEEAVALAAASRIPSSEVEGRALLALLLLAEGHDTAGCAEVELANTVYALHDLAQMTSTSGVLAVARVAMAAFRGTAADTRAATEDLERIRPHLEPLMPWYRPLAGGVLAYLAVRTGDLDGFRRYIAWCEQSDAPPEALCRRWASRARQEFAAASPLQTLSPAELRVWDLLRGRMTLSEIGDSLYLSRETVKSHTMSIYRKLGVASRREAQGLAESWS